MKPPRSTENELILGLVSISDRASRGQYTDEGIPNLEAWCKKAITNPIRVHKRLIPDERFEIEKTLRELVDIIGCDLILTTGGTGPARRDVTPEATLAVATRELPGFGEQMRAISGHFVPTAILSRQVGVLRETPDHAALILNLPGRPKAIAETLEGLRDDDGKVLVNGIFAAVPYCIDLIGGPYIETNGDVVEAFRPKSARRPKAAAPAEEAKADEARKPETAPEPAKPVEPQATPAQAAPEAKTEPKPEQQAEPKAETGIEPREERAEPAPAPFGPSEIVFATPRSTDAPAELTLVWLHGLGADNRDFLPLADEILHQDGPVCRLVMPNAPVRELTLHPGFPLRGWYDLRSHTIDENEDVLGIRESAARVSALIDELEANGIPRRRIVLGGFSQGAAISLYAGLRLSAPIGGIAALSGYLPLAQRLYSEATAAGRATPVFMAHGVFDSVVSPVTAERSASVIREVAPAFSWKTYDMEHEVGGEELYDLGRFLRSVAQSF
ncbi:molybdopterin adenylyltransferase [Sutterella megalosphaeroides]|uniref:Molybdopterin adenylyltransferase n=1 Tax=Sutterella megalosphaeroides TaxID=2494234 RepID=A0A2Z6IBW8_9BURK|nr:molybdopterin adenylyltransferase [Sutterella megalosphaeroides]BBF22568.1 hypothetical protein SUTMEG_04590 [Sutterella megalosphaeroides]